MTLQLRDNGVNKKMEKESECLQFVNLLSYASNLIKGLTSDTVM